MKIKTENKGFTLVEIMVAVSIFTVCIVMSLGSIISVLDANQKAKTLRSVMDNLNITLESMTRNIRFGKNYHCGTSIPITTPIDCVSPGSSTLTIQAVDGTWVTYSQPTANGPIMRSINAGTNYALTSSDVVITRLAFRVYGSQPYSAGTDLLQPRVLVVINGYVGTKTDTRTTFFLQTTITQKTLDFN